MDTQLASGFKNTSLYPSSIYLVFNFKKTKSCKSILPEYSMSHGILVQTLYLSVLSHLMYSQIWEQKHSSIIAEKL